MSNGGSSISFAARNRRHLLGLGSVVGGASLILWISILLIHPTGGYVGYLDPVWVLWNLGIGLGIIGLYTQPDARKSSWRVVGAGVGEIGVTLSIFSAIIGGGALLTNGGTTTRILDLQFILAVFGYFSMLLGAVILGLIALRDGTLPRWMAILLLLGSVFALGINDIDIRALLGVPFALAWIVIGCQLWKTRYVAHGDDSDPDGFEH